MGERNLETSLCENTIANFTALLLCMANFSIKFQITFPRVNSDISIFQQDFQRGSSLICFCNGLSLFCCNFLTKEMTFQQQSRVEQEPLAKTELWIEKTITGSIMRLYEMGLSLNVLRWGDFGLDWRLLKKDLLHAYFFIHGGLIGIHGVMISCC